MTKNVKKTTFLLLFFIIFLLITNNMNNLQVFASSYFTVRIDDYDTGSGLSSADIDYYEKNVSSSKRYYATVLKRSDGTVMQTKIHQSKQEPGRGNYSDFTVTENGRYRIEIYDKTVTDLWGYSVWVDITCIAPPDVTAPIGNTWVSTSSWTNGNVTIGISASDSQSPINCIKDFNGNVVAYGNGTANLTTYYTATYNANFPFYLVDSYGNTSTVYANIWNIDRTAPSGGYSLNTTAKTKGGVTATVNASDGQSGLYGIKKYGDGNYTGTSSVSQTFTVNGNYTFYLRDNAGNETPYYVPITNVWNTPKLAFNEVRNIDGTTITKTVNVTNIDKTAPTGSYSLSTTANTLNPVDIKVTMSDAQSGTDKIKLPDGSYVTGNTASYTVYESNTYNFTLYDKCGNAVLYPVRITNIVTPPKITFSPTTNADGTISLILTGTGGQDGIKYIMKSDGTKVNGASTSDVIKNNGTYHFEISDNGGTIIKYDKTYSTIPPNVTVTQDITGWTTKNIKLTVTASGRGSTLTKIELPDGTSTTNNTATYMATKSGKYEFKAYDDLGNVRDYIYTVENIDIDAPTLNYKVIYNKNSSGGVIQLNAIDTQSGFKSMTLPNETTVTTDTYNYPIDMDGIYLITVVDNLGNTRDYHINTLVGDNEGSIANHISSGLDKVTYRLTGATEQDWTDYVDAFYIKNEGITTITARAYDNAGNYTEAVSYARLDRTAPIYGGIKITLK